MIQFPTFDRSACRQAVLVRVSPLIRRAGLILLLLTSAAMAQQPAPLLFFTGQGLPPDAVGYAIAVLDSEGRPLRWIEHQPTRPFNPASTMKLVTTRAAFDLLGPDHHFRTRLLMTGRLVGSQLNGSLYFQGGGDPKLLIEDLKEIVARLRAIGVKEIRGNWVLDGSRFREPQKSAAAFDGQPLKPYNVTPHAAMMNFKAVRLTLQRKGGRILTSLDPALAGVRVRSSISSRKGGCGANQLAITQATPGVIQVSGLLGQQCPATDFFISPFDHTEFAFRLFSEAWRASGGEIRARPQSGETPTSARLLLDWDSPRRLIDLLGDINKMSNNPMARMVFLNLSAEQGGPGTAEDARERVRTWLARRSLSFPELVLDNGSGLSRNERISPRSMTLLLNDGFLMPNPFDWVNTLPVVGVEGTVRRRFGDNPAAGRAWVKTGTLEGVKAQAGYVMTSQQHWVAFTVFVNHPEAAKAAASFEHLLGWIVESL